MNTPLKTAIAVFKLKKLLNSYSIIEKEYQEYLESNPIVFEILGYKNWYPFTKTGKYNFPLHNEMKIEPDFICIKENQVAEIFEIKTPVFETKLVINSNPYRLRFKASLNEYISQINNYCKTIRQDTVRKAIKESYNIHLPEKIDSTILVGLNEINESVEVHNLIRENSNKIEIIGYDDLLKKIENNYKKYFGKYDNSKGLSISISLASISLNDNFLIDVGNINEDRASLYIEKNELIFELIDSLGQKNDVRLSIPKLESNKNIIIWAEIGFKTDQQIFSLTLGNDELLRLEKSTPIKFNINYKKLSVGANFERRKFGTFKLFTLIINEKYTSLITKIELIENLFKLNAGYVQFKNEQCLVTIENEIPDLRQDNLQNMPYYIGSKHKDKIRIQKIFTAESFANDNLIIYNPSILGFQPSN